MRFDLTHASYRVLQRASQQRLPISTSEITAAGLLISLFLEDECRAADWLVEAGLSLDIFRKSFGVEVLQSPISAPPFPMGDYGVPFGLNQGVGRTGPRGVEASPADDNPPPVGYPDPERLEEEPERQAPKAPAREPDQWIESPKDADETKRRTYSLSRPGPYETNRQSQARFYLDDRLVPVGRLSRELESAFELISSRFGKRQTRQFRRVPSAGGGVTTISSGDADFLPSGISLATEHLLLATLLDESDVGRWLHDNGFETDALFQRVDNLDAERNAATSFEPEPADSAPETNSVSDYDLAEDSVKQPSAAPPPEKLYRLLDAAANRAREALRVLEDYVRFMLDDAERTRRLKDFRHELREILAPLSLSRRIRARNTDEDIGTQIEGTGEFRRFDVRDVLAANFSRLQESLRSLEEFSKLDHPDAARRFERLRYRSYTLQKELFPESKRDDPTNVETAKRDSLEKARLYALIDVRESEDAFATLVDSLLDGGVGIVQLRDKSADDRTLLARSRILRGRIETKSPETLFIMNDRPDLAVLAGADGVHVGQEELPVCEARKIVGPDRLIGVSTHDIGQARKAVSDGADYIGAGPVFPSSTKGFEHFPGLDFLEEIAAGISIPAFAIGGITPENLPEVLSSGIDRVAVGAALLDAPDPAAEARKFLESLRSEQEA